MILLISINCGANNVYNEASHHATIIRTTKRIYRKRMGILVLANRKHVWVNFVAVNYIDAPMYREKVPKYSRWYIVPKSVPEYRLIPRENVSTVHTILLIFTDYLPKYR